MKTFSILLCSTLLLTFAVLAATPAAPRCGCKKCKCSTESHCGCFSNRGCPCEKGSSCEH